MLRTVVFTIEQGNVKTCDADVLALKYAQRFRGADKDIATALLNAGIAEDDFKPPEGKYRYVDTDGAITPPHALFIGVGPLKAFNYQEIYSFPINVLSILADEAPETRHLAMTIHGASFGLDESEACQMEWAGAIEALKSGPFPPALEKISFIELNEKRVERFRQTIETHFADLTPISDGSCKWGYAIPVPAAPAVPRSSPRLRGAAPPATTNHKLPPPTVLPPNENKPHAFIAMPFRKEMDDVYFYGIQQPVNAAGLLCERVDKDAFTGGVMEYVKLRIETASVVIAELTGANPNVYLEVGYAWGKGRPVILVVRDEKELQFDVRGQRCLIYERIRDLEEALTKEIKGMVEKNIIKIPQAK